MIDAARNGMAKAAAAGLMQLNYGARLDVDPRFRLHWLSVDEQQPQAAVVASTESTRGQACAGAEKRRIDDASSIVAQCDDLPGATLKLARSSTVSADLLAEDADPSVFLPYLHGNPDHVGGTGQRRAPIHVEESAVAAGGEEDEREMPSRRRLAAEIDLADHSAIGLHTVGSYVREHAEHERCHVVTEDVAPARRVRPLGVENAVVRRRERIAVKDAIAAGGRRSSMWARCISPT